MKLRPSIGIAAIASLLLASCYPVNENPNRNPFAKKQDKTAPALTPEQQKAKEAEDLKKKQEVEKKSAEIKNTTETTTPTENSTTETTETTTTKKEEPKKSSDYSFANKVPGKDGFVFSPYNNKVVDVRDIPSGTLVQDPTYPASEKKYFRVP